MFAAHKHSHKDFSLSLNYNC